MGMLQGPSQAHPPWPPLRQPGLQPRPPRQRSPALSVTVVKGSLERGSSFAVSCAHQLRQLIRNGTLGPEPAQRVGFRDVVVCEFQQASVWVSVRCLGLDATGRALDPTPPRSLAAPLFSLSRGEKDIDKEAL